MPLPNFIDTLTLTTDNPAIHGVKGGIRIFQLIIPYRIAKITVKREGTSLIIYSSNVRRFGFVEDIRNSLITSWSIDGILFDTTPVDHGLTYLQIAANEWTQESDMLWIGRERHPGTYGPISMILRNRFIVVIPSNPVTVDSRFYAQAARELADSFYIFYRGAVEILRDVDVFDGITARYNLIVLGGPEDNLYTARRSRGGGATLVQFLPNGGYQVAGKKYDFERELGAVFLAPSATRTRLCLIVSGVDKEGLLNAARTITFRSEMKTADYMIVKNSGIIAAGYWNNVWEYSFGY